MFSNISFWGAPFPIIGKFNVLRFVHLVNFDRLWGYKNE